MVEMITLNNILIKENISLDKSEFYGSAMIKFAYLHGIEIEK